MNIKVLYHSSTGNTKKIAEAIAGKLNITAEQIDDNSTSLSEPVDLLFIGDGVYAGKPNKSTVAFINKLSSETVKNVAVFATYGGASTIGASIADLLQAKGLHVIGDPFVCKGKSWWLVNRSHPSEEDLNSARKFADDVIVKI